MYADYATMMEMLRIANSPATFAPRRTLFADSLVATTLLVGALDRLGEHLDDALFPEHREQALGKPIFIVAAPRSGTTFLHRVMSRDEQFTTFKLVETFFPTISAQRIIQKVRRINGTAGGFLSRLRSAADDSYFGAWKGLHDTGLGQDEEDEALWALAFATPAIWLVLPFPERFRHLRFVDQLPADKRQKLVSYYRSCVQRHLYAHPGKTLLGKNVLLPGRFDIVTEALPEARFIHVVRHPYEAVPSTLSLFSVPWRWHSPEVKPDGPETRALAQLIIDYYKSLHEKHLASLRAGDDRFLAVTYPTLLADPLALVREAYARFDLTLTPDIEQRLRAELEQARKFKSEHHYSLEQFGLTREYIYRELAPLFEHYGFEP